MNCEPRLLFNLLFLHSNYVSYNFVAKFYYMCDVSYKLIVWMNYLYTTMMYINVLWTQMSRQWMYMADRRSKEFIDGVHEFIEAAEKHKYGGFVRCPSIVTCSIVVSCRTNMFGPSMEKEELCWIIM